MLADPHVQLAQFLILAASFASATAVAQAPPRVTGSAGGDVVNNGSPAIAPTGVSSVGNGRALAQREPTSAARKISRTDFLQRAIGDDPSTRRLLESELAAAKPFARGVFSELRGKAKVFDAPPSPTPQAAADRYATISMSQAWRIRCDADWTETCRGTGTYAPPAISFSVSVPSSDGTPMMLTKDTKFEVCRFTVAERSKSHGEWAVAGAGPSGVSVYVKSWGSGAFFDQWGGWVEVQLTYVTLITAPSTAEQRAAAKCSYTSGGGSSDDQGISEPLFCMRDISNPDSNMGVQMCGVFTYENGAKRMIRGPYACGVCFVDDY